LFGDVPGEPIDALAESLREHGTLRGVVPGLPGPAKAAVDREVAAAADGLLSLNLADLVVAGWKKYEAIMKAARSTRDDRNATEIVDLVTHTIQSSHYPSVALFVDGKSTATIKIDLQIAFTMAGVLAVVQQARLTAIRSGTCTVTGSLAVQQTVITKRQRKFDLPGAISLRQGVPLLAGVASTGPAAQTVIAEIASPDKPENWYSDPTRRYGLRWWDGSRWTDRVATQGGTMSDPLDYEAVSGP
jgi:hypothetical protein